MVSILLENLFIFIVATFHRNYFPDINSKKRSLLLDWFLTRGLGFGHHTWNEIWSLWKVIFCGWIETSANYKEA